MYFLEVTGPLRWIILYFSKHGRLAQISCIGSPQETNSVLWHLTCVTPQYGTCITSPTYYLEVLGGPQIFGKFQHP